MVSPSLTELSFGVVIASLRLVEICLLLKPEENKEGMLQRGLLDFGDRGIVCAVRLLPCVGVVFVCGVCGELCCVALVNAGFENRSFSEFVSGNSRICITSQDPAKGRICDVIHTSHAIHTSCVWGGEDITDI